jgi:hypothetical protein
MPENIFEDAHQRFTVDVFEFLELGEGFYEVDVFHF